MVSVARVKWEVKPRRTTHGTDQITSGRVSFPSRYACRSLTQPTDNKLKVLHGCSWRT